jgi:DNA modification methylase
VTPYWASTAGDVVLHLGKCETLLPLLPAGSIDAIITDPPAAVSFMGRDWDSDRGGRDKWVSWLAGCMEAAARLLRPGGYLLVWSLPRTSHWTALALEDAGLEIRDCIAHLFGSGFPKGRDIYRLDILPEVEQQLRDQGIEGEIVWR